MGQEHSVIVGKPHVAQVLHERKELLEVDWQKQQIHRHLLFPGKRGQHLVTVRRHPAGSRRRSLRDEHELEIFESEIDHRLFVDLARDFLALSDQPERAVVQHRAEQRAAAAVRSFFLLK